MIAKKGGEDIMLFDKFISKTIVKGDVVAVKPVHIGVKESGIEPIATDSPVLKDSRGLPVIPGSSLKGVLRSRVEAILSNPGLKEWRACNIVDRENACLKNEYIEKIRTQSKGDNKVLAEDIYEKSCDVCKLFGSNFMASKIHLMDMYFRGEEIEYEIRDGVGIDRDTETSRTSAKYDFEVVPAGAVFEFQITAENLDEKQEKLFELILKLLREGELSVGGMVSRGFGLIRLENEEKKRIDSKNLAEVYGL